MIKNETIRKKIEDKTENDPAMREFLTEIIENEYMTTTFSKKYNAALEKAIKAEGDDCNAI